MTPYVLLSSQLVGKSPDAGKAMPWPLPMMRVFADDAGVCR
jgi:hypothetical protein